MASTGLSVTLRNQGAVAVSLGVLAVFTAVMFLLAFVVAIDYLTFEYFLHRADVLERAKRDWSDFVKRGKAEARA